LGAGSLIYSRCQSLGECCNRRLAISWRSLSA
jgi:hypothetical protein